VFLQTQTRINIQKLVCNVLAYRQYWEHHGRCQKQTTQWLWSNVIGNKMRNQLTNYMPYVVECLRILYCTINKVGYFAKKWQSRYKLKFPGDIEVNSCPETSVHINFAKSNKFTYHIQNVFVFTKYMWTKRQHTSTIRSELPTFYNSNTSRDIQWTMYVPVKNIMLRFLLLCFLNDVKLNKCSTI